MIGCVKWHWEGRSLGLVELFLFEPLASDWEMLFINFECGLLPDNEPT